MSDKILSLGASYFEVTSLSFPLPDSLLIETTAALKISKKELPTCDKVKEIWTS